MRSYGTEGIFGIADRITFIISPGGTINKVYTNTEISEQLDKIRACVYTKINNETERNEAQ